MVVLRIADGGDGEQRTAAATELFFFVMAFPPGTPQAHEFHLGAVVDLRTTCDRRAWLRQFDLSKTPSGAFCRRVHPGSEMADQNDQKNGCLGQNGQNDPKGLVFDNLRFLGRFKPFLLH